MTEDQALVQVMTFGTYKGKSLEEIAAKDSVYLHWVTCVPIYSGQLKEAIAIVNKRQKRLENA